MGTKNNPGKFDCYANADPDEPMFVLLARDPLASILVDLWAQMRALTRGDSPKVLEAIECAAAMRRWKARAAGRCATCGKPFTPEHPECDCSESEPGTGDHHVDAPSCASPDPELLDALRASLDRRTRMEP